MNRLNGIVRSVQISGAVALADVDVSGDTLSALVVETDLLSTHLQPGTPVLVLFQETEVSLAKNLSGLISMRNRLTTRVESLARGEVLTRVTLDYRGQKLVAVITTRSAERLTLAADDEVEALIKANEVSLVAADKAQPRERT